MTRGVLAMELGMTQVVIRSWFDVCRRGVRGALFLARLLTSVPPQKEAAHMRTKTLFGNVHSVLNRYWLAPSTAALLMGALGGCGASTEGSEATLDAEDDLVTVGQDITGGDLVPGNFTGVVKTDTCSAVKLTGSRKFLTAAHCILNELATKINIFTANDGVGGKIELAIPSGGIQIHPSWKMRFGSNSFDVYDIATITTTTDVDAFQSLPLPAGESPPTVPSTATGYGFGCDNNDSTRPAADRHGGKRQSGFFNLTGGTLDHVLTSSGPDALCSGDSGGPLMSNTDGTVIGIADAAGLGISAWSRVGNVRSWIKNPKPGNDPSLFTASSDLFFMHNKKLPDDPEPRPKGLCMVAKSATHDPGVSVDVSIDKCSDPFGKLTGKGSGWTSLATNTAGRFLIVNRATGYCLQPKGAASGSNLQVATCDFGFNLPAQKWFYSTSAGGGLFPTLRIKNHSSNLCITTENGGTAANTNVEQATCDANANDSVQSWVATR
jgi:hypothetical protein